MQIVEAAEEGVEVGTGVGPVERGGGRVESVLEGQDAVGEVAGIETDEERIGESWSAGSLVVSWEDVLADVEDVCDRIAILQDEKLVAPVGNSRLRATPSGMVVLDALVADLAR